jgi:hypothetical protein
MAKGEEAGEVAELKEAGESAAGSPRETALARKLANYSGGKK